MSKINQFLILSFLLGSISSIKAQKLGIRAGMNLTNMKITSNDSILAPKPLTKMGAHFEMMADFAFNNNFSLESGIGISTKGYRMKVNKTKPNSGYKYTVTGKRSMTYLEIPVRLKMQSQNSRFKYFAALGPQFNVGLTGKWHTEKELAEKTTILGHQVDWNNADDIYSYKRLDLGIFAGIGVEINSLIVEFSYSGSLANTSATSPLGNVAKNKVFSLSVGRYLLRKVRNTTEKELMKSSHFEVIKRIRKYPKKSSKKKKHRRH